MWTGSISDELFIFFYNFFSYFPIQIFPAMYLDKEPNTNAICAIQNLLIFIKIKQKKE